LGESLNNILKNAISYINRDPVIKIVGREDPKINSITVKNDVDSISDHELKLVFEKFYRSDKSRNQSSGLGCDLLLPRKL
jgi:two-component system sensor histidine kinase VanS